MKFVFDDDLRPADSPFIEAIWRSTSEESGEFTSHASSHSEIVIARFDGKTHVTVRGPETIATTASAPADGEFFGIVFKLGTFIPQIPVKTLVDRQDNTLPGASNNSFWLHGSTWEIPTFDNADSFVARLVREGLLVNDPVVGAVLQGQPQAFSPRSIQYRFLQSTGLTHKTIQQIERAMDAVSLLKRGTSILDTTFELGYFDQAHLTNSLRRFVGQTPAQVAQPNQP